MILSTENGALRSLVGERRAIEILAKAGFDAIDYTFTFEIDARYGSATLTISNTWYSPVQYTGTITRIY